MTVTSTLSAVTVRGVRMAYEEAGAGRPLVCVHGNFASKRWFTEQLSAPPTGWRVIAPDLPNFGESDPLPAEASIEAYASYLRRFLDALGLERVVLLGHSLGGAVAQVFASGLPQRLSGLVLAASAPPGSLYGLPQGAKLSTPKLPGKLGTFNLPDLKGIDIRGLKPPPLRQNRAQVQSALERVMPTRRPPYFEAIVDDALRMHPGAAQAHMKALMHYHTAKLGELRAPVLVVHGARDTIITEAMARRTAQAFKDARLELWRDVGHSPQIEAPERFNALLQGFLAAL